MYVWTYIHQGCHAALDSRLLCLLSAISTVMAEHRVSLVLTCSFLMERPGNAVLLAFRKRPEQAEKHSLPCIRRLWEQFLFEYSRLKSSEILTRAHLAHSLSEFTEESGMLDIKALLPGVRWLPNVVSHYSIKQPRISETFQIRNLYYKVFTLLTFFNVAH